MAILDDSAFASMIPCIYRSVVAPPRADSNSICKQRPFVQWQTSTTHTIQEGNVIYQIPCFLLKHEAELRQLAKVIRVRQAVKTLAAKYNINIIRPSVQKKRYVYSQVPSAPVQRGKQYPNTFRMGPIATNIPSTLLSDLNFTNVNLILVASDSREIHVMNDDTITFSIAYDDMLVHATNWVSVFPLFGTDPVIAVVNSTSSRLTAHTGVIMRLDSKLVFIPVILRDFLFLYKSYSDKTSFNFLHIGSNFVIPSQIMNTLYFQLKTPCRFL
jgi:hypothetical protein